MHGFILCTTVAAPLEGGWFGSIAAASSLRASIENLSTPTRSIRLDSDLRQLRTTRKHLDNEKTLLPQNLIQIKTSISIDFLLENQVKIITNLKFPKFMFKPKIYSKKKFFKKKEVFRKAFRSQTFIQAPSLPPPTISNLRRASSADFPFWRNPNFGPNPL